LNPRFEMLDAQFSTADAESLEVATCGDSLRLEFKNWQGKFVVVHFQDVIAYSWDEGDVEIGQNHRDDCTYLVHDSPWIARHLAAGNLERGHEVKHFKLCFNAVGVLQVLASRLEVESGLNC
jgi:hypothetical protein